MTISYSQTYADECAECGAAREVEAWLIVDAQERPDLWTYAREGTLHQTPCSNGHVVYLGLPLLLHDGLARRTLLVPFSARLGRHPTQQDLPAVTDEVQQQGRSLIARIDRQLPPDVRRDYLQLTRVVPREELAAAMAEEAPPRQTGNPDPLHARAALLAAIDRPFGDAEMPARIELIRTLLQAPDARADRAWRAMLLWRLGTSYGRSSVGDPDRNTESAIEALTLAAELLDRESEASAWADLQLNLSTMYLRRTSGDLATDLHAAGEAAEAARAWHTEQRSPDRWQQAGSNLAEARRQLAVEAAHPDLMAAGRRLARPASTRPQAVAPAPPTGRLKEVLRQLSELQDTDRRRERIALLEEAVRLIEGEGEGEGEASPDRVRQAAMCRLALGNEQVETGDAADFDLGIIALKQARAGFEPGRDAAEWTATFLNSSAAWFNRRNGEREANLQEAIAALLEARDAPAVRQAPERHARVSYNLGLAWFERPGGDAATNLQEGVAALRDAQRTWTRLSHPTQWAEVQVQIGLGLIDGRTADLPMRQERAIEAFEAALQVYSRAHTPQEWARVQRKLGHLYGHRLRARGDDGDEYERAIQAFDLARTVYTRESEPLQWAATTLELAWPYRHRLQGDAADNRERALEAVTEALTVYAQGDRPELLASAQQALGIALVERLYGDAARNLDRAQAAFVAAQQVRSRAAQPLGWAALEAEIGSVHLKAGRPEQALASYEAAVAIYDASADELAVDDRIDQGSFYMMLGQLHLRREAGDPAQNWQRGHDCLIRAGGLIPRVTYPGRWANLQLLLTRALRECPFGNRAENLRRAVAHGRAALEVQPAESASLEAAWLAMELAQAHAAQGAWDDLRAVLAPALDAADRLYAAAVTEAARSETLARNRDAYALMIRACLRLPFAGSSQAAPHAEPTSTPPRPRDAFLYAEAGRSRLLRDQLGALSLPPPAGVPASVLALELTLLRDIRRLQAPALRGGGAALDRAGLDRLKAARDQLQGLWAEMRHRYRADDHVGMRQGERVEWGAVSLWLAAQGPGFGVLEFYGIDDDTCLAFVLRAGLDAPWVVDLGPRPEREADTFIEALMRHRSEQRAAAEAEERGIGPSLSAGRTSLSAVLEPLGRSLLAPLMPHLEGIETLCVVPYGKLHRLPIHALPWQGEPLIARMAVAYAPSVAVAMRMSHRAVDPEPSSAAAPLVVGDPAGDLPHARAEAVEVAGLLGVQPLLGGAADKASVVAALALARQAHFASHAHFDTDDPFASGLQLADGVLSARELYGQPTPTRLMVLSACETGVQQLRAGDERVGLARALTYAGVASLVLTLWRVDDRRTRELMLSFYRHRGRAGAGPASFAQALRAAVLETRQAEGDPYAWAAFIAYGDWR